MTVAELLNRISSHELTEWMAFYSIEPFGDQRDDLRTGIITSTIANVNRSSKQKPFTPVDFMPYVERPKVNKAAELKAKLIHLVKK